MTRLRTNFLYGSITDNPLPSAAAGASTPINSPGFANLPVVGGSDYLEVTLDPRAAVGAPEIVWVTAHASGATTVTAMRGQEGTIPRSHSQSEVWLSGPTALDFNATSVPSVSNVGDVAIIGTTDAFALANHVHGREGWASTPPTTLGITAGSVGVLFNPARHDHQHPVVSFVPTASAPGDVGNAGGALGSSLSASDHQHARESYGTPLSSAVTDSPIAGTGPGVAAPNHVHGREGTGAPTISFPSDANFQGLGPGVSYSDHKHGREGTGTPSTTNAGDIARQGAGPGTSYFDHVHARPAPVSAFGQMDNTSPSWGGGSTAMATISSAGAPFTSTRLTVPPSGIIRFDFSFSGWQLATNTIDFYLGVGWTTGTRGGAWAGSSTGGVGHTTSPWDYVIVWAGMTDGAINTYSNVKAISGSYTLGGMAGAPPNLRFYLLWGAVGGAMVCPGGTRSGAQFGTNLQVTTVP